MADMNDAHMGTLGTLAALISGVVVMGSFALSFAEGGLHVGLGSAQGQAKGTLAALPIASGAPLTADKPVVTSGQVDIFGSFSGPLKPKSTLTPTSTLTPSPSPTPITSPTPTSSSTPTNTPTIASPTITESISICGPPSRWVVYTVRPGDTLYRLSKVLGVSISQLQEANCLGNSTAIRAGTGLYVPFLPPASPGPTIRPPTSMPPPPSPTKPADSPLV